MIRFIYMGEAVGKGRPRYANQGGFIHAYTPKKTKDFEDAILNAFLESIPTNRKKPYYEKEVQLCAEISIYTAIPKSYSKKKRADCLWGYIAPTKKPDIDNICKSIFDALNGYAYADDSQIILLHAKKSYAEEPHVTVSIYERGEISNEL